MATPRLNQVWLSLEQSLAESKDTLLYELIHCIDYAISVELTEQQTHRLAAALLALMRDNPDLVAWLVSEEDE